MPFTSCAIVLLGGIVLLIHSSLANIDDPIELLSRATRVQISPNDTWSCCLESGSCTNSTSSPSCAFDGDSATRWTLIPGQRKSTVTVNLDPGSIIGSFTVSFSASSVIPSSVSVTLVGNSVTWTTYNNKSCKPIDRHLRKDGSTYHSCTSAGQQWTATVPEGVFSVQNGSNGWLWWRTFSQLQLTIEANDADYNSNQTQGSSIAIADIQLYGWNQPTSGCNCHPVGVENANAPCDFNRTCKCSGGSGGKQCIPAFSDQQTIDIYGPVSGGTTFYPVVNFTQSISSVTIGNEYKCLLPTSDGKFQIQTTKANTSDEGSALPLWICWARTKGAVACLATNVRFTYKPDPIVTSISPRTSILSGGITQTIIGENLDSAYYPYITVYFVLESNPPVVQTFNYISKPGLYGDHKGDERCTTVNSTMLLCRSMPFTGVQFTADKLSIGVSVDGGPYNNYTNCVLDSCDFHLANNPSINTWKDDQLAYPVYDGKTNTAEITGNGFQYGSGDQDYKVDYRVEVSGMNCSIVTIINNLIIFNPPEISTLQDYTKRQHTVLYVGAYYSYTIGDLIYYKNWIDDPNHRNPLVGGLVGGILGLIVLIVAIVLIVYCLRRREKDELRDYEPRYTRPPGENTGPITEYLSRDVKAQVEKYTVPYERIQLVGELGKGNFGKVFKGTLTDKEGAKKDVAIKSLHGHHDIKDRVEFVEEAILMADFCHKNVLSLIAIVIEQNVPYVVLPLMELGDLRTYISKDRNSFTVGNLVNFSLEVAEGMEYLASRKFVHRDLAARNCMINKDLLVKVADFGLARDIFEKDYYRAKDSQRPLPVKWMAIECLSSNTEFTEKSDVWSYGVVIWELMTRGKRPYSDVDNLDLKRFLMQGRRLEKPPVAPDFIYDLMLRCWLPDRNDRPRFKDIVKELKDILQSAAEVNSTPTTAPSQDEERASYLQLLVNQQK